ARAATIRAVASTPMATVRRRYGTRGSPCSLSSCRCNRCPPMCARKRRRVLHRRPVVRVEHFGGGRTGGRGRRDYAAGIGGPKRKRGNGMGRASRGARLAGAVALLFSLVIVAVSREIGRAH